MKKYVLPVLILALVVSFLFSRYSTESKSEAVGVQISPPQFGRPVAAAVSEQLRNLPAAKPIEPSELRNVPVREIGGPAEIRNSPEGHHDADASIAQLGGSPMPTPSISVDGLANINNAQVYTLLIIPPDMNGDVGPNHYFQVVNSLLRVFDKTGTPVSPPFKLSSLFEPLGTVCSTRNDGLAVVLYDPLADRWLISQTCVAFPPFRQMLAVSKTGDPLGQYSVYEYVMPNVKLNDFPKFGVWPDGYFMSTDEFLGADYVGAGAFAFDRTKLLAGDPTAGFIYFNLQVPVGPRQKGLLPADMDGLRPPPAGSPGLFASYTATEYGDAQDALRLYNFHADFNDPFSSTFTERPESPITVAAFDPTSPEGRSDISQPLPGEKLDSQSDRLNYRLAYRNFGTHESLVVNQTVRLTNVFEPYRAGVRVYELRKSGASYAVAEQTTIGDATVSQWIGSAAQDNQGNLAVQYNSGSEEKKVSIYYTGKLASDPPGVFRPQTPLIEGTGVQKAFGWRWGEYSGMNVDPVDDCTFWMTNAYYTIESETFSDFGWLTRIGSFKFTECTPGPRGAISGSVTSSANGQPIGGAVVKASAYTRATDATGSYGSLSVLPAAYQVTASARGYLPQTVDVTVADGQNITRNFALQPIPVVEVNNTQLAAESCAINGAPEPGEGVSVDIALRNTGALGATSLTGTLRSSSSVVGPGPPQSYGALPPNGPAVTRPFTFTVGSSVTCGSVVMLEIELREAGQLIGVLSVPIQTGVPRYALQENFDAVTAPELPGGWLTSSTPGHQLWRTSATRNQSGPNSLFSPAPHPVGLNEVISPPFEIVSPNAEIRFRNWYEFETTFLRNRLYDGSVLEIKLGDGEWQDIIFAGGSFFSGGYDGFIDGCCSNPLAGRLGWSGRSGVNQTSEFITTRAKLPAHAAGWTVRLRWRVGTDIGSFREGQYIDDLEVSDGYTCQCGAADAPFDFDGDGKTDLSVYELNSGAQADFRIVRSGSGVQSQLQWGTSGDIAANADFDGDGKTDVAAYRPAEGVWYVLRSSDNGVVVSRFGLDSDLLVPADYDGDGKDDAAVYRPSTGVWYILRSSDGHTSAYQFGLSTDKPVNDDFDGDGKTDIAVWRGADGTWYVARSSDWAFDIIPFGIAGDIPVSGDFDGDGKSDRSVYRPSTNVWYTLRSTAGFVATEFGLTGDIPMHADFDGDGRRDIGLFRPSEKAWFYLRSSDGGFLGQVFGAGNEKPVPAIFVDR